MIYPHYLDEEKTKPFEENILKSKFPLTYEYLSHFKNELLIKKKKYKTNEKYWYSLHRSRDMNIFEQEKILTPQLCLKGYATLDTNNFYTNAGCYCLIRNDATLESNKFYLSII